MRNYGFDGFTPAFFNFYKELHNNNNREWFAENKPRYERDVVIALQRFIEAMAPGLWGFLRILLPVRKSRWFDVSYLS